MIHICVGNLTIIDSNNGLSPGCPQAIIWTNAEVLLNWPLGTNFSEIEIHIISFKKMYLEVSFGKRWPFCLSLNVLNVSPIYIRTTVNFRVATRLSEKISLTFPWQFPDCHYKFQSLSWYIPCGDFLQYIQNHIEIVVSTRERFQNHMNCRHLMPADHYAKHENKLSSEKNHLANDIWLGTLFEILS